MTKGEKGANNCLQDKNSKEEITYSGGDSDLQIYILSSIKKGENVESQVL
jgi:hypothetical protein